MKSHDLEAGIFGYPGPGNKLFAQANAFLPVVAEFISAR